MPLDDMNNPRKFRFEKPRTPEETLSAIYEELNIDPSAKDDFFSSEHTVKSYLHGIHAHLQKIRNDERDSKEDHQLSESISLGSSGLLGLLLIWVSSQTSNNWSWWNANSYILFAFGTILTVMFVAASIEKSSLISHLLKYNSVKWLCALLFSAAVIYSTAQANTVINEIFGIDGSNFPYSRAILSTAFFLKICTPFLFLLALFALMHLLAVWGSEGKNDFYTFPWRSLIFIIAALVCGGSYWWITHRAFGDSQITQKTYKLVHYLDFNNKAYCVDSSEEDSYLFFGNDQNKVLIDKKLELNESFEDFLKGSSIFGKVTIPKKFKVLQCIPKAETPT